MQARRIASLDALDAAAWDRLDTAGNPFVSRPFLAGLEATGCLRPELGWRPGHVAVARDDRVVGLAPAYEKRNSHGEFVFDHAWADAHHRLGIEYYPKLVCAVPYSPVTGPRLLVDPTAADARDVRRRLLDALADAATSAGWSGAHVNFVTPAEIDAAEGSEWIQRSDVQFHWRNPGYGNFEDFLATLRHKRRKEIRRERQRVAADGWSFEWRHGDELDPAMIATIHALYAATFVSKGNYPALSLPFFEHLAASLGRRLVAILAIRDGRPGAMALCLRGEDTLYGRYWGAAEATPGLHFEACYYQGIEYCIAHGLAVFEPGAQGEHKVARGFLPVRTHSLHYIAHPDLRRAIAGACARERRWLDDYEAAVRLSSPYARRADDADPVAVA
jgi:predicted N-acyltransferase